MHHDTTGQGSSVSPRRPWVRIDGEPLGHVPAFDGVRGLFVPLIVAYHAQLVNKLFPGGGLAIDGFFVISGFLITTLLLDEVRENGAISLRMFYARRALRLFPAMYLMIAVFILVFGSLQVFAPDLLEGQDHWWGLEALGAATYSYHVFAAFFPDQIGGVIGHTWSLSVEEQFYFLWPAVFFLVMRAMGRQSTARRRPVVGADRWLVVGAIGFIVSMFAIRFAFQDVIINNGIHTSYVDQDSVNARGVAYRLAASRPDMIVLGCLVAIGARHIPRPVPPVWLSRLRVAANVSWVLFFFTLLFSGKLWGFDRYGEPFYQLAMLGIGFMTLDLFLRKESRKTRFFSYRPLRRFGLRTYGIYVWHVPVLWFFLPALADAYGFQKLALGLVGTLCGIGAGFLSFRFIEKPFLRMKMTRFQRIENKKDDTGESEEGPVGTTVDLTDAGREGHDEATTTGDHGSALDGVANGSGPVHASPATSPSPAGPDRHPGRDGPEAVADAGMTPEVAGPVTDNRG